MGFEAQWVSGPGAAHYMGGQNVSCNGGNSRRFYGIFLSGAGAGFNAGHLRFVRVDGQQHY